MQRGARQKHSSLATIQKKNKQVADVNQQKTMHAHTKYRLKMVAMMDAV